MVAKNLVIVGAGEFALIAYEYFTYDSDFEVRAFAVDQDFMPASTEEFPTAVITMQDMVRDFPTSNTHVFVAIPASGLNRHRREMCDRIEEFGYELASYVSSRAFVWRNVSLGKNCFIFEGNVLQPFVTIGDRCILWSGNHIGHRSVIESDVFIASHVVVSGYCRVGRFSFLGVNSTLNDHIEVGEDCIIGAGSHVNRSTESGLVYVGSPARAIPNRKSKDVEI